MKFPATYSELVASSRDSIEFERGAALALGYSLGLTASHSDILDYRAMLARERGKKHRYCPPAGFVLLELRFDGVPFRVYFEDGTPLA